MSEPEERSAVSTKTIDILAAAVFIAIGILVIVDSVRLGFRWGADGPEAGYFPFYIGLIMCIASVVNAIRAFMGKDIAEASFVSIPALKMVLMVLLPTILYVLFIGGIGPIPGLGIYVSSVIFIALFMVLLGKYTWLKSILVGVGVMVTFFLMFEVFLKVPLPKGPIEAALGLN